MAKNWILGQSLLNFFILFSIYVQLCDSQESNSYTVSSFKYPRTVLKPYDWSYIRVELPPWFSLMTFSLESDVDLNLNKLKNTSGSSLPMICFREGSPPLPDVYNTSLTGLVIDYISNGSFVGTPSLQNVEKCYPMQKNIWINVTNEQISPGTWYFGLFNGIGPIRTQSKMINRGPQYSFSSNITVEGCTTSMLGQFCNQTINSLSCNSNVSTNKIPKSVVTCKNADGIVCHLDDEPKVYSFDITGIAQELIILTSNVTLDSSGLMCYARLGAMPVDKVYDFSGDVSKSPLVINFPKSGRWYITIRPMNISKVCYVMEVQVFQCPVDKAGSNCTLERYTLQTVLRKNPSVPFESYYLPITEKVSPDSSNFPLEPLFSNFSSGENQENSWTFFPLNVPSAAAGGNIHIHLTSDSKINYEIYARYGALPSLNDWDYFYTNATSYSNGSMFFKLYDSTEDKISFYLLYVKGGIWNIGLRRLNRDIYASQTELSLSLERCPQKCSSHGTCQSVLDASGLALFSYCSCDRNHGGFDCSVELVSHRGHIRQSIFLIASNAAAVLPAYWALRDKAFAEWVLFTCSGISSALYHACDVGTWCALPYRVLQFLDFWLSFMAVVSTFVYLATISEVSKRTIHTVVAILTALMAQTGPTRSSNIVFVIAIGALGLLIGWIIEFCSRFRSLSFSTELHLNLLDRWEGIKKWIRNVIKTLIKRFRWGFTLAGFVALAMAAISWKMESTESYWIWHSLWHISIYTSSFLFLCSKAKVSSCETERSSSGTYELTRQNSSTREEHIQSR